MGHRTAALPAMAPLLRQGLWPLLLALLLAVLYGASGGLPDQRLYAAAAARTSQEPPKDIAVIAIDDASLAQQGAWPWPRDRLAQLVDQLAAASPRSIVLALPLEGAQSDRSLPYLRQIRSQLAMAPAGAQAFATAIARTLTEAETALDTDQRLATSLRRAGNVLLMARMEVSPPGEPPARVRLPPFMHRSAMGGAVPQALAAQALAPPLDVLGNAAAGVGQIAASDGLPGDAPPLTLLLAADGALVPSLALLAAAHSLHLGPSRIRWVDNQGLRLGSSLLPASAQAQVMPLPYARSGAHEGGRPAIAGAFPQHSAQALLAGKLAPALLQDRTVVVGLASAGAFPHPQQLAEHIAALRQGHVQTRPAWAPVLQWAATLTAVAVLVVVLPALGAGLGYGLTLGLALAMLALEWGAMQGSGLALPLTLPAAVLLLGLLLHWARRAPAPAAPGAAPARSADPEADRMMGLALQGQGQLDMAFARLRRVRGSPQVVSDLMHLAQEFENKLRFDQAVEVYTHILRQDKAHEEARKRRRRARHLAEVAAQASLSPESSANDVPGAHPATLGRYQIEKELGRGAMGVVYQGRDPKISRTVAIKALALGQEFEGNALVDARSRFFREAESAGRLQHQHIVTIYDVGEDQGLAWMAMELLKGQDLVAHTQADQLLPVETVVSIAARVADALDYAHQQNVIHRDIKPANIMYDAQADTVKVSDFGIARITDNSKTRTGLVLGTPSFMAPEQLAGRRIDGRCDLYALGVTLFQLLTGELPLRGKSMSELMHHIAHTPAPDVRSLRPDLSPELAQVLAKALSKNPQDRYQTGRQLADALRGVHATAQGVQSVANAPIDVSLDYDGERSYSPSNPMPDFQPTVMDADDSSRPLSGPGPGAR